MNPDPQPVFRALADPTRRAILEMLAETPKAVNAIVDAFEVTRPAVAKHLKILEESGLIRVEAMGRKRINHLNPRAMASARAWMSAFDRFWDEKLDSLKREVEKGDG
ncbi:MAG: metalloregulator ArsR/SmtB family transcription factor [Pseudomonadota bacterium]